MFCACLEQHCIMWRQLKAYQLHPRISYPHKNYILVLLSFRSNRFYTLLSLLCNFQKFHPKPSLRSIAKIVSQAISKSTFFDGNILLTLRGHWQWFRMTWHLFLYRAMLWGGANYYSALHKYSSPLNFPTFCHVTPTKLNVFYWGFM